MDALDLRSAAPRPARAALDGIVFLPRSIDKVRATLPGGHLNGYALEGLTHMMLEMLGISLEAFVHSVREAHDDDAVAAFVRGHARAGAAEEWNRFVAAREPRGGDRDSAITVFPWLAERSQLGLILDVLDEDDRRHYAAVR